MKSIKIEFVFIVVSIISAFVASTSAAQETIGRNKLQPSSYPGASCLPDESEDPNPYPYPYPGTPSEPASIVVTNTNDAGPGSLRQALNDICAGGAVLFDLPLAGQTIHLSSKLEINKQVTIYGANLSPNIKISGDTDADGSGDVQIMTIDSSAKVKIVNIDFENGKNEIALQSGGINNSGILSIYNSTFSGNTGDTGGAILNSNSIYIENSVFESNHANNGGALHTSEATIRNSSFIQNTSLTDGGAISSASDLILSGSVFTENSAILKGGAIMQGGIYGASISETTFISNSTDGDGGAIYNISSLFITGSTFTQNEAGNDGGALYLIGNQTATIINSTITNNHANKDGGSFVMRESIMVSIRNSTITENTATSGVTEFVKGSSTSHLELNNTIVLCFNVGNGCYLINLANFLVQNSIWTEGASSGFGLAPLADNGGLTQTMALLPGSPAIDAGDDDTCEETDQRGVERPQGSQCDIGAYELEPTIPTTPTFADVSLDHPYFADIEILYANGLTAGCSATPLNFCPATIMNRAESAVFMLKGNFGNSYTPPLPPWGTFKDSWAPGTWAEKWAEGMYDEGLTAGCALGPLRFCPWDQTNREQAAVFGLKLKYGNAYLPPPATGMVFADMTDPNYWSARWTEQAYADGLLPSCGIGAGGKPNFCPTSLVSRGLAAYMIVRAKDLSMP